MKKIYELIACTNQPIYHLTFLVILISINVCPAQHLETTTSILPSKQWSGANGLVANKITSAFQSQSGFLWITSDHGLMRFDGKDIEVFNQQNTPVLKTGSFEKIYEDKNRTLWFTSHSNGIIQFRKNSFQQFPVISDNRLKSVHSLQIIDDHAVWVGTTNEGLLLVRDNLIQSIGKSLTGNSAILDLLIDKNNNLWIATDGNGLIKYDGFTLKQFTMASGLNSNFVNSIAITHDGHIMAGTSNGLNVITFGDEIISYRALKDIPINSIKTDILNRVWIGTDTGLIRIYPPEQGYEVLTKENGSPYSRVSNIHFDSEGNVWVSTTGSGLFQINDPDIVVKKSGKFISSVFMQSFQTDKSTFSPDSDITVKPGNNRYTFNFTSPGLAAFYQVQFKYRLDGVDRFWVSAGTKHQVEYTNLEPGTYKFQVIASADGHVWSRRPATVTFYVSPFFYQTAWFLMLMISLIILSLYGIYKWRVHVIETANAELRKVNAELDRFIYSASHDLRSPLTSMLGLIALSRLEEPGVVHNYITKIETCVKNLDRITLDIKDFSCNARTKQIVEQIDFHKLIDECISTHQYADGFKEFDWKINISAPQTFFSDPKRLKVILSNLISNSIKYGNPEAMEQSITIDVSVLNSSCAISVSDNGIGIAPEHIKNIFDMFYRAHENSQGSGLGLYIVRETVSKLRGIINVHSEPGKGTTFTISLPATKLSSYAERYSWQRWSKLRPMKMVMSSSNPVRF